VILSTLDFYFSLYKNVSITGAVGLIGNPVRCRSGPAAVVGDEIHKNHCPNLSGWEGVVSRMIREPEDLPVREVNSERWSVKN